MMNLEKDLTKENFIGMVVYNKDPDLCGRCKVRVIGLMDDLETNFIPWFSPAAITTFSSEAGGGNFSVPKVGTWVKVHFANNDVYSGEYTGLQNIDPNMFEGDDMTLNKDDYDGTHVLLYDADQELMLVFQPHSGITLYYRQAKLNIAPSNEITLMEPNGNSMITLNNDTINIQSKNEINVSSKSAVNITTDVANIKANSVNLGKSPTVHAVNGDALVGVLTALATAIQNKYPISPGMPSTSMMSSILSSSVMLQP